MSGLPQISFTPRLAGFQPVVAFKNTFRLAIGDAFATSSSGQGVSTFHLVHMEPRGGGETTMGLARCLWNPAVKDANSLQRIRSVEIAPLERMAHETEPCFAFDAIDGVAWFTKTAFGRSETDGRLTDVVMVSGLAGALSGNTALAHTALMDLPNRVASAAGVDVLFANVAEG